MDGKAPTLRQIAKFFSFTSLTTVRTHLDLLQKKGALTRGRYCHRGIRLATA